jgi:hypothetical protein
MIQTCCVPAGVDRPARVSGDAAMESVTIRFGKIPPYRGRPSRKSWGFEISDQAATFGGFQHYTCARAQAQRVYETILKPDAQRRGFEPILVVDQDAGLNPDLSLQGVSQAELVRAVKQYARKHHDRSGWDCIAETYTDDEIARGLGGVRTVKGAIRKFSRVAKMLEERRKDSPK